MAKGEKQNKRLEEIAELAYSAISRVYPVCCMSDEFYFFPQVLSVEKDWRIWDDFSMSATQGMADLLISFEQELSELPKSDLSHADQVDKELLKQVFRTLRSQLVDIAHHKTQPTFHLTVLASGLAETLEVPNSEAWPARISGVSDFLRCAAECLDNVPVLFQQLGLNMLQDIKSWLAGLQAKGWAAGDSLEALDAFRGALQSAPLTENYCLKENLLETLIHEHIGCGMSVDAVLAVLQEELERMTAVLLDEASSLAPGTPWIEAEHHIPFITAEGDLLLQVYLDELKSLEVHCRVNKFVPEPVPSSCLKIKFVPEALAAIRASDAYAATPGYPPHGGTFYVMQEGRLRNGKSGRTLEYRMTAVHEAWPGHHLLDTSRWGLERSIRRPVESPLFYEGWACMAEELMAITGYLHDPWDRFLLARRRAERAARGIIDIGLQRSEMSHDDAVETLVGVGYRKEIAAAVVPKYLLRPGYQVCYTLGLMQGLDLLERFGKDDLGGFVRKVLQQGEIGFKRLDGLFSTESKRSSM